MTSNVTKDKNTCSVELESSESTGLLKMNVQYTYVVSLKGYDTINGNTMITNKET